MRNIKASIFYYFLPIYFLYAAAAGILFAKKSPISYFVGIGFFMIFLYISITHKYKKKTHIVIFCYIFFLLILILQSSNFVYSAKLFIKATTPFLLFIVSNIYVRNYFNFQRLNFAMIALMLLFIFNIIISNVFNLGSIQYENEETIDIGNIYTIGLNSMAYVLVSLPVILNIYCVKQYSLKIIISFFSIITFIIMLILLKRGALLGMLAGYVVWFITSNFKNKTMMVRIIVFLSIALLISLPLYKDLLISKYHAREERLQIDSYETEGRFLENEIVFNDIFSFEDPKYSLLGHEMFNSPGNYGNGIWGDRQLHNDYANLLNGSGIVGLLFYFYMNYIIFVSYNREKKRLKANNLYSKKEKLLNSLFLAFFFMYFIIGLSGGLDGTLYSGIRYIYLGAITSIFHNIFLTTIKTNESSPKF